MDRIETMLKPLKQRPVLVSCLSLNKAANEKDH